MLGSVATIESGTTYYTTVYNYDSTVDGVNTFRFTCIVCILNQILALFRLIDCFVFYAVSTIFQPNNGGDLAIIIDH